MFYMQRTAMEPTNARENAMSDGHSKLPWSFDGSAHFNDYGGEFHEIKSADGGTVFGENGYMSAEDAELVVAATHAYRLMADGWSVSKISMYDEEGVEGWQWTRYHNDREYTVIGSWDELPPIPGELAT
jgi:hypothetical protein